jgi:Ni,Fe-hydrogenase III large subunit
MKIEQPRAGSYTITLTAHELSALLAGARMSLSVMTAGGDDAEERPRKMLGKVLDDLDAALRRLPGAAGPEGAEAE